MWRTYQVYYYDRDMSGLLLDAVRPFMDQISPHVGRAYYSRHWLRGPHVRINVEADPEVLRDVVRPALDSTVGAYLTGKPSTAKIDPAALLEQHTHLAEREHEPSPLTPLRPDNSIHEGDYDRRLHVLGNQRAVELLADFYSATTVLAFDTLDRVRRGDQLAGIAFDIMIASAHGLSGVGLQRGFVSFRSHSEAFLSWWPEAEGLRQKWDAHYAAHAESLATRVRTVMAEVDAKVGAPTPVSRWLDELTPIQRRGSRLIATGELAMDPPWAKRYTDDDPVVVELVRKSPFHSRRRPPGEVVDRVWFDGYRLVLNYTYLQLTRLGLGASERFLLCHLAANAAEDLFGVAATDTRLPAPGEIAFPHTVRT